MKNDIKMYAQKYAYYFHLCLTLHIQDNSYNVSITHTLPAVLCIYIKTQLSFEFKAPAVLFI